MKHTWWLIATAVAVLTGEARAQNTRAFSGTWKMDTARSESTRIVPWYERQDMLVFAQTATELRIERPGGLQVAYRLDGSESLYDEGGQDISAEYRRKVRTQLSWAGSTLITRTTPVREDIDQQTGKITPAVGVTTIEEYTLDADGTRMTVRKSGRRNAIPATLHGLAYDPETDPLVRPVTDVFTRTAQSRSQSKPDFSGMWTLDASRSDATGTYGTVRIITQTAEEVNMVVLQREAFYPEISVIPWQLRMGRYGPRRGGERSREPLVQSRWDGDQLITLKAPGQSYSVVWIWTLRAGGNELVVESIDTGMPSNFDFKRSSIPKAYAPSTHVYVRVPIALSCIDCPFQIDANGLRQDVGVERGVVFRLQSSTEMSVTCLEKICTITDIVGGKRQDIRRLAAGRAAGLSLSVQRAIGLPH